MGLMTKMPSPTTAHAKAERKAAREKPPNAGSSGLNSINVPSMTTCIGSDTRTARTRLCIRTLSALLITRDSTLQADTKNMREYPTANDPNTAVLSSGYEQSTVDVSPDTTEVLELQNLYGSPRSSRLEEEKKRTRIWRRRSGKHVAITVAATAERPLMSFLTETSTRKRRVTRKAGSRKPRERETWSLQRRAWWWWWRR